MQSYGGDRTGAGQRSVVLAFSKQSMTDDDHDDDDDQESIGRRPKRAALTVVVLGFSHKTTYSCSESDAHLQIKSI